MRPTGPEVADVFRKVIPRLPELKLSADKLRIFKAIVSCRTAALGAHIRTCTSCGFVDHSEQAYNSCWNRHCPKCRGGDSFSWVQERCSDLLPVPYFHLVFTIPHELRELVRANKRLLYAALFEASSETLLTVAKNNLSLSIGFFGVLHTWNQELLFHPHIHYLVPGGGLHTESKCWQALPGKEKFFLPVRILGAVFRGIFIARLKQLYREKKLYIPRASSHLENPHAFEHFVSRCAAHRWVVYAKRPFAGPERVIKYLAGYTHRVGISNSRIRSVTDTTVTFMARSRGDPSKRKPVTITNECFVRRFLQHGLPRGFRRIRYFGFLAVHQKCKSLELIRNQLHATPLPSPEPLFGRCPRCSAPALSVVSSRKPHSPPMRALRRPLSTPSDILSALGP